MGQKQTLSPYLDYVRFRVLSDECELVSECDESVSIMPHKVGATQQEQHHVEP